MDWYKVLIEPWEYFHKAMLASTVCGITCGLIGCFIILRRMALVGDALAHAVLPGVVIGFLISGKSPFGLFIGAVVSGVLTSLMIGFVNRSTRVKEDTAIGVVFTGFFALGVMMISRLKRVHLDLSCYLFGQPLAVNTTDLWLTSIIGAIVVLAILLFYKQLVITSFDPVLASSLGISAAAVHYFLMTLLSMTVVASIQAVGVVLVVAMLITPGATAYLLTNRMQHMLWIAALVGAVSAIIGMYVSYWLNLSSGEAMVVVCAGIFGVTMFLSPKEGILVRAVRRMIASRRARLEDYLKQALSIQIVDGPLTAAKLAKRVGFSNESARSVTTTLQKRGYLTSDGSDGKFTLTLSGKRRALDIIRAHRLWETYLVNLVGLSWDKLHAEAERIEHVLTPEMIEALDETLARPKTDPHGAPIPSREGEIERLPTRALLELAVGDRATIVRVKDEDAEALRVLQELSIHPQTVLEVVEIDSATQEVVIKVGSQLHRLNQDVAEHILVSV